MEKLLGWHDKHIDKHAYLTMIFMIPAIAVYVFALRDKRNNDLGGKMTWKQGFMSGLIITLIVTLLSPLTQYITSKWITPDYFKNVINYTVEHGMKTMEEAQAYFNLENYIVQSVIGAIVMGIITSAIVALFVRNSK